MIGKTSLLGDFTSTLCQEVNFNGNFKTCHPTRFFKSALTGNAECEQHFLRFLKLSA